MFFISSSPNKTKENRLVGRKKEIKELNKLYENNRAELVAIFGRLRVGKTYLVDEVFSDRITN